MTEAISPAVSLKRNREDDQVVQNKKQKHDRHGVGSLAPQNKGSGRFEDIMYGIQKNKKADASKTFKEQKENHIKLMCAQIKNQLPGDEVDHDKFMQTFFQMMNTEQILQMNERLYEANNTQKILARAEQLKYIKKDVNVESATFHFDGTPIEANYKLPEKVDNPILEIFNKNNSKTPVLTIPLDPDILDGSIVFDGQINEESMMDHGDYRMRVRGNSLSEKGEDGLFKTVTGQTYMYLPVDGIEIDKDNDQSYFVSGKMIFTEQDIRGIKKQKGLDHYKSLAPKKMTTQTEMQTQTEPDILFAPSAQHEEYLKTTLNEPA